MRCFKCVLGIKKNKWKNEETDVREKEPFKKSKRVKKKRHTRESLLRNLPKNTNFSSMGNKQTAKSICFILEGDAKRNTIAKFEPFFMIISQ